MPYDHPNYIVRAEQSLGESTAGSGTVQTKFSRFQKFRLKSVAVTVTIAGSSASPGAAMTVSRISGTNTTSVGLVPLGTATAGAVVSSGPINALFASGDIMTLTNGTDGSSKGVIAVEFETLSDAVQTA
jgi:hypothetical protein